MEKFHRLVNCAIRKRMDVVKQRRWKKLSAGHFTRNVNNTAGHPGNFREKLRDENLCEVLAEKTCMARQCLVETYLVFPLVESYFRKADCPVESFIYSVLTISRQFTEILGIV